MDYMDRLERAVRNHSGMDDEQLKDCAEHGADAGWPGFTYSSDTSAFFDANAEDIFELAAVMANDIGSKNVMEFFSTFKCADSMGTIEGFKDALAWFALEEVARFVADR